MQDEDSTHHARLMLEAAEYRVVSIPTSPDGKRADLEARFESDLLIIEAKSKAEHKGYLDLLATATTTSPASCTREEKGWNGLSSIIEGANEQLKTTPYPQNAVRIFWISCLHGDWEFVLEGFRHRLHGSAQLNVFRKAVGFPEFIGTRTCFYYDEADFRRYRDIDAAVLAGPDGAKILVNEFGGRVDKFRETRFYREMRAIGALVDPTIQCAADEAFAIRDSNLRDPSSKRQYLYERYGIQTSPMQSFQFKSVIL